MSRAFLVIASILLVLHDLIHRIGTGGYMRLVTIKGITCGCVGVPAHQRRDPASSGASGLSS